MRRQRLLEIMRDEREIDRARQALARCFATVRGWSQTQLAKASGMTVCGRSVRGRRDCSDLGGAGTVGGSPGCESQGGFRAARRGGFSRGQPPLHDSSSAAACL